MNDWQASAVETGMIVSNYLFGMMFGALIFGTVLTFLISFFTKLNGKIIVKKNFKRVREIGIIENGPLRWGRGKGL
jgi:hypothetical protein